MAASAKVQIHVQAEFAVDLLDHVSLFDRRRMFRSGRWDVDGLARSISPRTLLDLFVKELVHAMKPVNTFFSVRPEDAYVPRRKETSHKQSYSLVAPSGRTVEVVVDATIFDPDESSFTDNEHNVQRSPVSSSNSDIQIEFDQRTKYLQDDLTPSKIGFHVKFEPYDNVGAMGSRHFPCHPTSDASTGCQMIVGDLDWRRDSLDVVSGIGGMTKCFQTIKQFLPHRGICFPSESVPEKEANKISRSSVEKSHGEDSQNTQVHNSLLSSFVKEVEIEFVAGNSVVTAPKSDQELALVSSHHGNILNEDVNIVAPLMSDSRSDLVNISPNSNALYGNMTEVDNCIANDQRIDDMKPSIVGKKRILCDGKSYITNWPVSSPHATVKNEPFEECGNDKKLEKLMTTADSSSNFLEKIMEFYPQSSVYLDSVNEGNYSCSAVPILSDHEDIRCSSLSHHCEVGTCDFGEKCLDFDNDNHNSGILVKVEASESDIANAIPEHLKNDQVTLTPKPLSHPIVKEEPLQTVSASLEASTNVLGYNTSACVKLESISEYSADVLDHIPLMERLKMLVTSEFSSFTDSNTSIRSKSSRKHTLSSDVASSRNIVDRKSGRRRKRRKTATDSVETALEEDAPELLQVLIGHGVKLEEIKLYSNMEDDDILDSAVISSSEDGFEELESIISKLFMESSKSLLNLASIRGPRGSKAVYCLSCLVSLIEQTQYLQLCNCPVQWGWCRDLQSFIFVFEKHNRIVLERPEYGYATYFFEIVDSLPIDWQIMRLVTAMKATHCSRISIMENKSLMVGQDITEGEARVLEEYGWMPNSGLGSLLNFCDRVVHDRRTELDNSEWKAKISKILMNGFDGGRLVVDNIPKKVVEYMGDTCQTLKSETDYL